MDNLVFILTKPNGKKIIIPYINILFIEESIIVGETTITLKEKQSSICVTEPVERIEEMLRGVNMRKFPDSKR